MTKWVNVNDGLPEKDTVVLVMDDRFIASDIREIAHGYTKKRVPGLRFGYLLGDGETFRSEGVNGRCNITHWMPLPEPPEDL